MQRIDILQPKKRRNNTQLVMSSRGGNHLDDVQEIILNHAKFTIKKAGEELQKEELQEIKHIALKQLD